MPVPPCPLVAAPLPVGTDGPRWWQRLEEPAAARAFAVRRVQSHQFPLFFKYEFQMYSFSSGIVRIRITVQLYLNKVNILFVWGYTAV